jgi:hypothetical protein
MRLAATPERSEEERLKIARLFFERAKGAGYDKKEVDYQLWLIEVRIKDLNQKIKEDAKHYIKTPDTTTTSSNNGCVVM